MNSLMALGWGGGTRMEHVIIALLLIILAGIALGYFWPRSVVDYTPTASPVDKSELIFGIPSVPPPVPQRVVDYTGPRMVLMGVDGTIHSSRSLRGDAPEKFIRPHGHDAPTHYVWEKQDGDVHYYREQS